MRSFGILKNARILTSKEMMSRLSDMMLGATIGVVNCDISPIKLIIEGQPNMLMRSRGNLSPDERDIERAKMVREALE